MRQLEYVGLIRSHLVLLEVEDPDRSGAISKWLAKQTIRIGAAKHIYVAGGAVRDFVMGKIQRDVDVVVDHVSLGKNAEWFAEQLAKVIPVRTKINTNRYGAVLFSISEPWEIDGHQMKGEVLDIANADVGKDKDPMTSHLLGFDFTFNTLAWRLADLAKGRDKAEILDLTGCGLKDIKAGILRCPSDPDMTFSKDPSRILRVVKFLVRYGNFKVPNKVAFSIKKNASKLKNIPDGVISNLLMREIFTRKNYKKSIEVMNQFGLIDVIGQIMTGSKGFMKTMTNWSRNQDVGLVFDLIEAGLPLLSPIDFLSTAQQRQFKQTIRSMSQSDLSDFLTALKQPGKVIKDKKFMSSTASRTGRRMGRDFAQDFTQKARDAMLGNPKLTRTPLHLKGELEKAFGL